MIGRLLFAFILLAGIFASCRYDEEIISSDQELALFYSEDTLSFDTVFTVSGSITKRLVVRNPNRNAIQLDRIYLGRGSESPYSIIVAGDESSDITGEVIYGEDSLLVLVNVTIDPNEAMQPFIVRDSILFAYNNRL